MTGKQRKYLRGLAHPLKPVVNIGQRGLAEAVLRQVERALADHELIKVKLTGDCPVDRQSAATILSERLDCEVAGILGRVLVVYRPAAEQPRIRLPGEQRGDGQE